MCEIKMVKKKTPSKKELEDILWKEEYKAMWKRIHKEQNDPDGEVQKKIRREQYYVDNMTLDSRSASVVGKEEGEHWWRFAPQAVKYRAELNGYLDGFTFLVVAYMTLWFGIALWFLLKL